MEDSVTATTPAEDDAARYVQMFEAAEEASEQARTKAERDRDYYDGKQLTQDEHDELVRRGQPPIAFNVIRDRVDFHQGLEKKQRRDPKAYPRNNPNDVQAADAFTDGLRYATEQADYQTARSQCWKNICAEGYGALELRAKERRDGSYEFEIKRLPWDRLFYDPHSAEPDFSDAKYLGAAVWMDQEDAIALAVSEGAEEAEAKQLIEASVATLGGDRGRTYDDKPKWTVWVDKRKRVRVCLMWHQEGGKWFYCGFTKGGKLWSYESPYVDEDGEGYCPWIWESCYVDRDNNRYGVIRDLIDPQDEINKRRSKALHQSVSRGVVADQGAVEDVNKVRRELTRPDFYIEKVPNASFEIIDGQQLVAGQAALLQDAMNYIAMAGPNKALLGEGTQDQSGRAIEAQQQGGLITHVDLLDTLRRMDWRVFKMLAQMIKQFWTAETWIRVTDDEMSPRWVGLNVPEYEVDPYTGQQVPVGVQNNVADLDMDIIVSDAPDVVTMDGENYQAFTQLLGAQLPPPLLKIAIEMHPGLTSRRKKQLLDMLEQLMAPQEAPPEQRQMQQMQIEREGAETNLTKAKTYEALARGEAAMMKASQPPPMPQEMPFGA